MDFDENLVIEEFRQFLQNTVPPHGTISINADGNIHRYTIEGDRLTSKNGAYKLHLDELPAGYCKNWKTGDEYNWKHELNDDERRYYAQSQAALTPKQRKERLEAAKREQECRKTEEKKRQKESQHKAFAEYLNSKEFCHETSLLQHPYWRDKFGILKGLYIAYLRLELNKNKFPIARVNTPCDGDFCKENEILVPMIDIETGVFQSLIHIPITPKDEDGKFGKPIYPSTSSTGAGHWVIQPDDTQSGTILVSEGITTAIAVAIMSVLQGRKDAVLSVGGCGNLEHACRKLRKKYPESSVVIMSDNDTSGLKNANKCLELGIADKESHPPIDGWDWYDYVYNEFRKKEVINVE